MENNNGSYLVTGGVGHIGSYIVEYLSKNKKDSKIIVVDNLYNGNLDNIRESATYAHENKNELLFCEFDICDNDSLELCFEEYKPTQVYHQASLLTLDTKLDRRKGLNVNVGGFINIMECCLKFGVDKLVYASSASVFGDPHVFPTAENHDFKNCSLLYGASKVCNEFLATSYAREEGLKFVGLRYFNVYGHRQPTNNVYTQIVPKWINAFINGDPITIYGNGSQTMDMISGQDVGMMNILAMENDLYCGKFFVDDFEPFDGFINIGTGIETSVRELFEIIKDVLAKEGVDVEKSEIVYEEHDPCLVKRRKCDTTLMTEKLACHQISVREGIEMTVKELLK